MTAPHPVCRCGHGVHLRVCPNPACGCLIYRPKPEPVVVTR